MIKSAVTTPEASSLTRLGSIIPDQLKPARYTSQHINQFSKETKHDAFRILMAHLHAPPGPQWVKAPLSGCPSVTCRCPSTWRIWRRLWNVRITGFGMSTRGSFLRGGRKFALGSLWYLGSGLRSFRLCCVFVRFLFYLWIVSSFGIVQIRRPCHSCQCHDL